LDSANNIIPFINKEEDKIISESRKILGNLNKNEITENKFNIVVNATRVPTLYSHLISIMIILKAEITVKEFKKRLISFSNIPKELNLPTAPKRYIRICAEEDRPQPALDFPIPFDKENGMIIKAGRIEKTGKAIKLFILFNNTVRGAAGTSVLNAEYAVGKGLIGGREK
jgi:aspartate-semialdehyde dehydrogenase